MKFILLLKDEDKFNDLSPAQAQEIVKKYQAWAQKLRDEGRLVDSDGLSASGRIISVQDGAITDGPYAETRETIGGYYVYTADSLEQATEIAKECPSTSYGASMELRAAMTYDP